LGRNTLRLWSVFGLATIAFAVLLSGGALFAQSADEPLTAEQIKLLLDQQTRGLVIAPSQTEETVESTSSTDEGTATNVNYTELAKENQINIRIEFDFDSAAIKNDQRSLLAALCTAISESSVPKVQIIGHTDASGSAAYNSSLSKLRAEEVKRYLVGDCGIDSGKLEAVGVGEEFPLDRDNPRAGQNRRVEVQALIG
jgi:OOP family OmpA-OmpF porin